jgi:hypothetical protein
MCFCTRVFCLFLTKTRGMSQCGLAIYIQKYLNAKIIIINKIK